MSKGKISITFLFLLACMFFAACKPQPATNNQGEAKKTTDTLNIWADSSLSVIVNEQKKAFENLHSNPVLFITYKPETDIMDGLINNRVSCAILQRSLLNQESAYLQKKEEFMPKQHIFAYSAFVAITQTNSPIQALSLQELEQYFSGRATTGLKLTVENKRCQSIQFLRTRFKLSDEQVSRTYANQSLADMLDYLKKEPRAVGIIPFSYITDINAPETINMLRDLKVLPVTFKDSANKMRTVIPSQETISTKEYPMINPIVLVNANMEKKSGTNFVNYLFKTQAQRLILKCGLCPAIFPGREIIINTN
jgi:phosphate transport system substrate-binding protein